MRLLAGIRPTSPRCGSIRGIGNIWIPSGPRPDPRGRSGTRWFSLTMELRRRPRITSSVEKDPVTPPYLFKMWYLVGESAATGYATSRDGIHWQKPLLDVRPPTNIGGFLVVGDELCFYVSGRSGRLGGNKAGTLTTGLATLRRDGFASMDADEAGGTLTTPPVRFTGRHLFVNVDDPKGELRVEILNEAGEAVPRFTVRNCLPVTADTTLHAVRWTGVEDLSSLTNQPVRFRFHLKNGRLFAFWVSPEKKGASHGYVAAGGPGFSSNRDLGGSPGRVQ